MNPRHHPFFMGRKAVICECSSNGTFLVEDCRNLGLEPVAVYLPIPDEDDSLVGMLRRSSEKALEGVEVIHAPDAEEVARMLSGSDVACVIAGTEFGVPCADELSRILGLPGNDPSTTRDRTEKLCMHMALERAGLRSIRTSRIDSAEDLERFWKGTPVVLKPSRSGGTVGFHLCRTLDECIEALGEIDGSVDWVGGGDNVAIAQDFIEGPEYIVNTLSRDGVHRVTDMWAYHKQNVGIGMAYDCAMTVTDPSPIEEAVASYAVDVLRATGMENGPAHIEVKSDKEGPVLIEINARPMGGAFTRESLDRTLGHHITDLALRSAVDPGFISTLPEGIPPLREFILKVMIVHEDRYVDTGPLYEVVRGFRSFNRIVCPFRQGERVFVRKTEDLELSPASVELIQPDGCSAMDDFALLSNMEKRFPDLLYGTDATLEPSRRASIEVPEDFALLDDDGLHLPEGQCQGLAVTVTRMPQDEFYRTLYAGIASVPSGRRVVVDRCVEDMVPYGRKGLNVLLMVAGLEFDLLADDGPLVAVKP